MVRQIAYHLHMSGHQVGMLMLEETVTRTAKLMLGLHMKRRLHLNPASQEEMRRAWNDMFRDREIVYYDHFGSTEIDNLLNRVRYMATALKCRYIVLDHLSIAVSGLDVGDERKELDLGMTKLRQLVQELDICLLLVVHLKRPSGDKGFEQVGMRPRMNHIRGTQGIAQLSDSIITGAPAEGGATAMWVEKNRLYGDKHGDDEQMTLQYDKITGWFSEIDTHEFNDEQTEGETNAATSF
jgi:twinkle protein